MITNFIIIFSVTTPIVLALLAIGFRCCNGIEQRCDAEKKILNDTIDSYIAVQEKLEKEVDRLHEVDLKCRVLQIHINDEDAAEQFVRAVKGKENAEKELRELQFQQLGGNYGGLGAGY